MKMAYLSIFGGILLIGCALMPSPSETWPVAADWLMLLVGCTFLTIGIYQRDIEQRNAG